MDETVAAVTQWTEWGPDMSRFRGAVIALTVVMLAGASAVAGSGTASALPGSVTINGTLTSAAATQTGRLFRNNIASTCATPKAIPSVIGTAPHFFDSYDFAAAPGTCVSVTIVSPDAPNMLFVAAYSNFTPADPSLGHLADPGQSSFGNAVTFSFTAPPSGLFKLVVSDVFGLAGPANYTLTVNPASALTVVCTNTITGTHAALSVTSGTTCVNGAHITGGISVAKGAALDIENSTVSGSISANAVAGLRICGSTTGSIAVSGATGVVLIGGPAYNCAANTINAGLTAANNKDAVIIVDNTIAGSLTVANNTGAHLISGNHH